MSKNANFWLGYSIGLVSVGACVINDDSPTIITAAIIGCVMAIGIGIYHLGKASSQ